jgi:nitroimidazol reductase NimA-like FMN-containing flavoprotein (pyridoxamine 5'-phosphate oxidase superfamily)
MTDTPKRSPRMTEDEVWAYVTDAHTGILTTLRRDGVPVALPVWYACIERTIYVSTRGKKLLRIAHDPRASFLVESGDEWADLRGVHLTGTASVADLDRDLRTEALAELDRKYAAFRMASDKMPSSAATTYANTMRWITFTPDARVLNWDNARLLGTR